MSEKKACPTGVTFSSDMRTDCPSFRQSLELERAGELAPDAAARLEIHLASCDECRLARARLERLDERLRALLGVAPPAPDELLLMALRARAATRREHAVRSLLAAAAVILTLALPAASYFTFEPEPTRAASVFDGFGGGFDVDF